jgi:aspartate/methionine/tyrosine aminotransferase
MQVDEISESPILSLIDQIFRLRQDGRTVLGLHIGEPDLDTPSGIREAAYRAMNEGFTHYVAAQGMPDLRAAIAQRLRDRHRIPCGAEDVVVMSAKFAIYATLLSTVGPGDEVLLPNPTYLFEQPLELVGAHPVYVPLNADFSIDAASIRDAITSRSRAILLVTPANPTGRVLSLDEVRSVVELAREHHLTVISDETYESLIYEGAHVSAASVADPEVPVVTVGSFSKTYAMTGWRAGFAVAPPSIKSRLVKVMEHTLTCVPPFIQQACVWALENGAADEERIRSVFRGRRDHLLGRLQKVSGLSTYRPSGAFYAFPKYDLPMRSVELCSELLREEQVAVVPGVAFGPEGERHVRISYTSPVEALDEGVARIERFLDRHRSRSA